MKRWIVQFEDRTPSGGPYVCFIRRDSGRGVGPSCVGTGANRRNRSEALRDAIAEVRYRREAGQFSERGQAIAAAAFVRGYAAALERHRAGERLEAIEETHRSMVSAESQGLIAGAAALRGWADIAKRHAEQHGCEALTVEALLLAAGLTDWVKANEP